MTKEKTKEKVVVIGGTGLIGSKVVNDLNENGFEAVAAAPNTGVNTLTGEGLAEALEGASVVVDVSNSPSFEEKAVMDFFTTSTGNLLKYEQEAGVKHHVALSVVGTERLTDSAYMRAKVAQEKLIEESPVPYTIIHATQFFEFIKGIADAATDGDTARIPAASIQPMAADDVAAEVAAIATANPQNAMIEIGGPEVFRMDDIVQKRLKAQDDTRTVVSDPKATYFGAVLTDTELLPGPDARLSTTRFDEWLRTTTFPPNEKSRSAARAKLG
jgi:uncharacterized protein YbjT (DUF2867 family)